MTTAAPSAKVDAIDMLAAGVATLTTTEAWTAYLATAAKFHRYSANNVMLISWQRPEATQVAGFRAWQALGRQVRKGERGIRILAPCMVRDDDNVDGRRCAGFVSVAVFDVSQTDGDPIPGPADFVHVLDGDDGGLAARLERFAAANGFHVVDAGPDMLGYANGWWDPSTSTITLLATLSPAARAKTLAHELGHALLGHSTAGDTVPRPLKEIQAESVAFIVLAAFGLDSGDYSFGYLATWGADAAPEMVKAMSASILAAAHKIIDTVGAEARV